MSSRILNKAIEAILISALAASCSIAHINRNHDESRFVRIENTQCSEPKNCIYDVRISSKNRIVATSLQKSNDTIFLYQLIDKDADGVLDSKIEEYRAIDGLKEKVHSNNRITDSDRKEYGCIFNQIRPMLYYDRIRDRKVY